MFTCQFLLHTGARINEARNVCEEDIDFQRQRLVLKVTKAKARKGENRGKPRVIPVSQKFLKIVKKYIKANDRVSILSTPATNTGLKKACRLAGIKDFGNFSAHNLRKTLEVWLMSLGVDGLRLTAHLGHDLKTAAHHYVSPDVLSWKEREIVRGILGDLYEPKYTGGRM